MKAVVHVPGGVALAGRPEPRVQDPGDAIVRMTTAGICGSDLHVVEGRDPVRMGTILGHELVGVVEEKGTAVTGLAIGDRVVSPFTVSCGRCFYCERSLTARCVRSLCLGSVDESGAGLEGAQAEHVRVPLASSTLVKVPERRDDGTKLADEDVLFLGDIFATAYTAAETTGVTAGGVVAVVGLGPVGLLAVLAARLLGAGAVVAADGVAERREKALELGASAAVAPADLMRTVSGLTEGRGADGVVEAVGSPPALDLAIEAARPGAVVSVAGFHTEVTYPLPMPAVYAKNLSLRFGRTSARTAIDRLLPLVQSRSLPLSAIVSHILPLEEGVRGYEMFRARQALKVLLKPA